MTRKVLITCLAAALMPVAAAAQTTSASLGPTGYLDFGVRGTHIVGDAARYERFRDLTDGLFLENALVEQRFGDLFASFTGEHLGRSDQRLVGRVSRPGKLEVYGGWDQIPMLFSRTTQTMYAPTGFNELRLADTIQATVQLNPANITTMVNQFAEPFELATRRHIGFGGVRYIATEHLTLRVDARYMMKDGAIPYGGSFGHSSFVELPAPVQHNTTDLDANAEYVRGKATFRVGYTASLFQNDVTQLVFDNPYRLQDIPNTPSAGRSSLPPSSNFITVNGTASYALARRTRVTGFVSFGTLSDTGATLMPNSINTSYTPAPLERTTLEGGAQTRNYNVMFTSRPVNFLGVNVRYKFYDYDNETAVFDMTQRIAYDNNPSNLATPIDTEPFSITRHSLDADVTLIPEFFGITARAGYTLFKEHRELRVIDSTEEHVGRLVLDAVSYSWFSLRGKYEWSSKRGTIDPHALERMTGTGCTPAATATCVEHEGMRHYDIAERDRNRVTVIASLNPFNTLGFNFSAGTGHDDYLNTEFGLLDNRHFVYTGGVDYTPAENVLFSTSYAYERYEGLSRSRQATRPQFFDVTRNWSTDTTDKAHSLIATAEFSLGKLAVRVLYDYNLVNSTYIYGTGPIPDRTLPEESDVVASTLPDPKQLPPTRSEAHRGSVDFLYPLNKRVSAGFSYWYDAYDVDDFTLDENANPSLDRGSVLLLGYIYKPYTAQTFWGRIVFRF